jgi:RimJ/RimL family protein N-acetyltransferase
MVLQLETQRLMLRPLRLSDAQVIAEYRSDPQIARYQSWNTPFSISDAKQLIEEMRDTQPGTPGKWYQLAIELIHGRDMIGDCAFYILEADDMQAEIGFTLAR